MKYGWFKYTFVVTLTMILCSCSGMFSSFGKEEALATVDANELYLSDFSYLFTPDMSYEDSAELIRNYTNTWVKNQLKVIQAEQNFDGQLDQIGRMVRDYRNSLLNFQLEQQWVNNQIDSLSIDNNIEDYYQKHKTDFVISGPIVKGKIVKLPESYRQQVKLKSQMLSSKESDQQDFIDICIKNNFDLYEFNDWTEFNDFMSFLPTIKGRNYDHLLKDKPQIQEMADATNKYFILISEHLSYGDQAPLAYIQNTISRILYNELKQEIIKQNEQSLYQSALQEGRVIINLPEKNAN